MVRSSKGRGVIFRVALLHAVGLFFCAEAKIAGFAAGRGRPQTRAFSKGAGFLTFLKKRIYWKVKRIDSSNTLIIIVVLLSWQSVR